MLYAAARMALAEGRASRVQFILGSSSILEGIVYGEVEEDMKEVMGNGSFDV